MVRTKKIFRKDLIQGAYDLILEQGLEHFNARNVARQAACSTQPIYREFENLTALKESIDDFVIQRIDIFLFECNAKKINELASAVIRYASKYPQEFQRFFLEDTSCSEKILIHFRALFQRSLEQEQQTLTSEEQSNHFKLFWFYTLGKATFCAHQPKYVDEYEHTLTHLLQS